MLVYISKITKKLGNENRISPNLWNTFNNRGPGPLLLYYLLSLLLAETIRLDSRRIYSDKTPENGEIFTFEFTYCF